jgi:glycosyltransferase involved in cell wall biosynthesis
VAKHLDKLDVFMLSSREDTYPLVVVEAASLGVPTIYFDQSGGIYDFIDAQSGIRVDYLDVQAMANAIEQLKNDPVLLKQFALNVKVRFLEEPKEKDIISKFLEYLEN